MRYVTLTGNLKRRWQYVKDIFPETEKPNFWADINKFAQSMTKNFFEIALEKEIIQKSGDVKSGKSGDV